MLSLFFAYGTVPRVICTGLLGACVIMAVFRLFSTNRDRRYRENQRFLVYDRGAGLFPPRPASPGGARRGPRTHRAQGAQEPVLERDQTLQVPLCPQCTQRLRVPRGKGRLLVTCTRCGNRFEAKS